MISYKVLSEKDDGTNRIGQLRFFDGETTTEDEIGAYVGVQAVTRRRTTTVLVDMIPVKALSSADRHIGYKAEIAAYATANGKTVIAIQT